MAQDIDVAREGKLYVVSGEASPGQGKAPAQSDRIPQDKLSVLRERAADPANKHSDPRLLEALLLTENGAEGYEFGYGVTRQDKNNPRSPLIVPDKYKGFTKQAGAAAYQIRVTEERYQKATGQSPVEDGQYTNEFIQYFSQGGDGYDGYAPVGAANDPDDKNIHHYPNLKKNYQQLLQGATSLLQQPKDISGQSYLLHAQEEAILRIEQQEGAITQAGLIGDAIEAIFQKDRMGRAEFARALARSGLTRTGITPEDIPDEMTGRQFLEDILHIPPEVFDEQEFIYDPNRPAITQVMDWLVAIDEFYRKGNRQIIQEILGEATGPVGFLTNLGAGTFMGIKRLGKTITELKKTPLTESESEAFLKAREKFREVESDAELVIRYLKGEDPKLRPLPARTQTVLDNDILSVKKMNEYLHLPNHPTSDAISLAMITKAADYVADVSHPLMVRALKSGDPKMFDEAIGSLWELTRKEAPQIAGATAAGKTLKAQQILELATRKQYIENYKKVMQNQTLTRDDMLQQLLSLPSLVDLMILAKNMAKPGLWKGYNELLVTGFLSGFSTWLATNPVSNMTNVLWYLTKTQVAGLLPKNRIGALEAYHFLQGMRSVVKSELKLFAQNLKHPTIRFGGKTKIESMELDDFAVVKADSLPSIFDPIKPGLNRLAHWNRIFIRLAIAQDELSKGLIHGGALFQGAHRIVRAQPKYFEKSFKERGRLFQEKILEMQIHPEKFSHNLARSHALGGELTLTGALGKTAEALIEFSNSHPGLKMMMLFTRTPTNGWKMIGRETPLIGQLRDVMQGKFTSKDPFVRSEAWGKLVAAGLLADTIWSWSEAKMITGMDSPHPATREALREKGFRPGSIAWDSDGDGKVDQFRKLVRGSPMGAVVELIATAQQLSGFWSTGDKEFFASAIGLVIADLVEQSPFLGEAIDFSDTIDLIQHENSLERLEEQLKKKAPAYLFPPLSGLRQGVTRAFDPVKREVLSPLTELQAWVEMMAQTTPGYSKTVPPILDPITGKPEIYDGGWGPFDFDDDTWGRMAELATPFFAGAKTGQVPKDSRLLQIYTFMAQNATNFLKPPTKKFGVELTPLQQRAWTLMATQGKIPEGYEMYGIEPTKQLLTGSMVDKLYKQFKKPDQDTRVPLGSGTFRLAKVDNLLSVYKGRYEKAFGQLVKNHPLFEGFTSEVKLLNKTKPLEPTRATPSQIDPQPFDPLQPLKQFFLE